MANDRNELAEKLELVGQIFEIDGMAELLSKYDDKMSMVKFNAVTIQITSLLLKKKKRLADKIIALTPDMDEKKVQELSDAEYASRLKSAILSDVMGFFASSPHSDGAK